MKKKILRCLPIILALVVTACGGKSSESKPDNPSEHTHTFAEDWSYDEGYHWHAATCGHDEVKDKAAHSFLESIDRETGVKIIECSVCHYKNYEFVNVYTVVWMSEGTVLARETYFEGDVPSYKGATPTKDRDADYNTYEFIGWDKTPGPIASDTTYTAQFRQIVHTHTAGRTAEENRREPTCTEAGSYNIVTYCAECGKAYQSEPQTIPALGHNLEHVDAREATCTTAGWNAYDYCTRCSYSTKVEIPATGHQHTNTRIENQVEATCTTDGSYDIVTYCLDDGAVLNTEHVVVPKLGHDLVNVPAKPATCTESGYEAYSYCSRCDYTTRVDVGPLGHDFVRNEETLVYECSRAGCNETNGRDYRAVVDALEPLHVGDVFNNQSASISFVNDDDALEFVEVIYYVGSDLIFENGFEFTEAQEGQDVTAVIYLAVKNNTYVNNRSGCLINVKVEYDGVEYPCLGSGAGDGKTVYCYQFPFGKVLPDTNEYTVTWKNYNDTVLETDTCHRGDTPSYDGETPTRPATAAVEYYFTGWDKEIVPVTGNVEYIAQYGEDPVIYSVSFVDHYRTYTRNYQYGMTPDYTPNPDYYVEDGVTYVFSDWDKPVVPVTEETQYAAVYVVTDVRYELNADGTGYIVSCVVNSSSTADIIVPDTWRGLPVVGVKERAFRVSNAKTIILPDTVTSIGNYAFNNARAEKIVFGNGVTELPSECCSFAQNLKEVVLPNDLTTIGDSAFYYTALEGCLHLPNSVTTLKSRAFGHTKLEAIRLGPNVSSLSNTAFEASYQLLDVVNESSLTEEQILNAGSYGSILSVVQSVDQRGTVGVEENGIKYYIAYGSTEKIVIGYEGESGIFTIPNGYSRIKSYAFCENDNIKEVNLGEIDNPGRCTFAYSSIEVITISPFMTVIPYAFLEDCRSLTTVNWADGACVVSVDERAFSGCISLTSLTFNEGVVDLGENGGGSGLLTDTGVTSFHIPNSCQSISLSGAKLSNLTVGSENQYFKVEDYGLYSKDGTCFYYAVQNEAAKNFVIADTVTKLYAYSIFRNDVIESLYIPASVQGYYGNYNIQFCCSCSNLETVTYGGTVEQFNSILKKSYGTFAYCPKLTQITCSDGVVTL